MNSNKLSRSVQTSVWEVILSNYDRTPWELFCIKILITTLILFSIRLVSSNWSYSLWNSQLCISCDCLSVIVWDCIVCGVVWFTELFTSKSFSLGGEVVIENFCLYHPNTYKRIHVRSDLHLSRSKLLVSMITIIQPRVVSDTFMVSFYTF